MNIKAGIGLFILLLFFATGETMANRPYASSNPQHDPQAIVLTEPADAPEWKIRLRLERSHRNLYDALSYISRQTGLYFVYDSQLLDNNRRIQAPRETLELQKLLQYLIDDTSLRFRLSGRHIVIYRHSEVRPETSVAVTGLPESEKSVNLEVRGRILDASARTPLPFATAGIPRKGRGTAANSEGEFRLSLPSELLDDTLQFSYVGYKPYLMPVSLIGSQHLEITLEPAVISMQEVIIRYYDPLPILTGMLAKREENYSEKPALYKSFYREGVLRNNKLMSYAEAVFEVYKPAYYQRYEQEQVRLLKSRQISNVDRSDTLIMKLQGGVKTALELDIMKSIPEFLDPAFMHEYTFTGADLVSLESGPGYAIEFEQAGWIHEPLFMGILYVDKESLALIAADFEVNPRYVNNAQYHFLRKRSRQHLASIEQVRYQVSYQKLGDHYHLKHVRGELTIKFRRRNHLFSNTYQAFTEMVVSHVDTTGVRRFDREQTLNPSRIFADEHFAYDYSFWQGYTIIPPETLITEAIQQIRKKIESLTD